METRARESNGRVEASLGKVVLLGNIDYDSEGTVVLAVNTSYEAVGFYIYQESADEK